MLALEPLETYDCIVLFFGHIGITLGAALLSNRALTRKSVVRARAEDEQGPARGAGVGAVTSGMRRASATYWGLMTGMNGLDLRFLLVGSLLPDIVDKPIGHLFLRGMYGNGYLYGHTLLFALVVSFVGLVSLRAGRTGKAILLLAFGIFMHLILDGLWRDSHVLLWPLFGFAFERVPSVPFWKWLWGLILELPEKPWGAIPEMIGAVVTIWFVWLLWRKGRLRSFFLKGHV